MGSCESQDTTTAFCAVSQSWVALKGQWQRSEVKGAQGVIPVVFCLWRRNRDECGCAWSLVIGRGRVSAVHELGVIRH